MKEKHILYNKDVLLILNKSKVKFISIYKLKQYKDYDSYDEIEKKKVKEEIKQMLKSLSPYDKNTGMKQGELGSIYKIIHYYKRLSKLQQYILSLNKNETLKILKGQKEKSDKIKFKELKENLIRQAAIGPDFYTKEDYIVIQSVYWTEELNLKKGLLEQFLKEPTEENFNLIKNNIDILLNKHKKACEIEMIEKNDVLYNNKNYLIKLLSKLSLTEQKVNIYDRNFRKINIQQENYTNDFNIKIYKNEVDDKPKVIKISNGCISEKKYLNTTKYNIVNEEIKYEINENEKIINIYNGNEKLFSEPYYKIELDFYKPSIKNFILTEIPTKFSQNITDELANSLKKEHFDEFTITTEITKQSLVKFIKKLNMDQKLFELLTQMKALSLNNKGFDINLAIKKANAIASMISLIQDEDIHFMDIRYYVSIKTDFEDKDLLRLLNKNKAEVVFDELIPVIEDMTSPITDEKYLDTDEKVINLSTEEVSQLICLKYGNTYFSGRNEDIEEELPKINRRHGYVLREEQLQTLNLFDGPEKFNFVIVAGSGGGKSFMTVNLLDNFIEEDDNNLVWIVDRGGSYIKFTNIHQGNNISISAADSNSCINPFLFTNYFAKLVKILYYENKKELSEQEIKELEKISKTNFTEVLGAKDEFIFENGNIKKAIFEATEPQNIIAIYISFLKEMIKVQDLETVDRNRLKIEEAIVKLIAEKYEPDKDDEYKHYILVEDIKNEIIKLTKEQEKKENKNYTNDVEDLLSNMNKFIEFSAYGNLFNRPPALDLDKRLINIDLKELQDEDIQTLVIAAILSNFFVVMTSNKHKNGKKILLIDEAHAVLNAESELGIRSISYLFRTTRKHGAAVGLISQNISDFAKKAGEAPPSKIVHYNGIIGNAGWIFLLKQHPYQDCIERLGLKKEDAEYVATNNTFKFFVKTQFSGKAQLLFSDFNYAMATTHKEEKNMTEYLKFFIKDNDKHKNIKNLILFAYLFGVNFVKNYQSVDGFINNMKATANIEMFKNNLIKLLEMYNNVDLDYVDFIVNKINSIRIETEKEKVLKVLNAILILIITKQELLVKFFDVIFKEFI